MAFQPRFRGALRHALEDQPVEDGYQWLKYGQKMLSKKVAADRGMGSNVRRHYFQCKDRACPARRFIDQDLSNPSRLKTTYRCQHTCGCSTGGTTDMASTDVVESDSVYSESEESLGR